MAASDLIASEKPNHCSPPISSPFSTASVKSGVLRPAGMSFDFRFTSKPDVNSTQAPPPLWADIVAKVF
jgi:hypothetical protein